MHWSSFSQMVSQKHCSEPKNGFGGENGGWCIGDALKWLKKRNREWVGDALRLRLLFFFHLMLNITFFELNAELYLIA